MDTVIPESLESCITLKDGNKMPMLGLGTYNCFDPESVVASALKLGYRHVDTATLYMNESEVGAAIKKSGLPREDIFVTTKLWYSDHGRDSTIKAFEGSLNRLGLDYIDLYLMHSPLGGKILESWDVMIELQKKGKIRSVGVSNFNIHHLEGLKKARPDNLPVVNQIEMHPFLTRTEVVEYCQKEGIVMEAYAPLAKGDKLNDPKLTEIAKKYGKTSAQIMIRWSLQRGVVCIPKTQNEERLKENISIFDFTISQEDMADLSSLNQGLITDWLPDPLQSKWEP